MFTRLNGQSIVDLMIKYLGKGFFPVALKYNLDKDLNNNIIHSYNDEKKIISNYLLFGFFF